MNLLTEEISEKLDESMQEVEQLKIALAYEKLNNPEHYELLSKYAPSILFSIWEGFFKESIKFYFTFFNRNESFDRDLVMLTNIIEHNDIIKERYTDFKSRKNLLKSIKQVFENPEFNVDRPHIDCTNWSKMNNFLKKIKLYELENSFYSIYRDFAWYRNQAAHGDYVGEVSFEKINNFGNLVIDLMQWLESNIIDNSRSLISD